MTSLPTHLSPYALDFTKWRGKMARKDDDISPHALVSLRTRLLMMARKDGEEG